MPPSLPPLLARAGAGRGLWECLTPLEGLWGAAGAAGGGGGRGGGGDAAPPVPRGARGVRGSAAPRGAADEPHGKVGADEGEVAEMIEASLVPRGRRTRESGRPMLLTTRREALALYRDVLRYSNLFVWRDERGRVWRDVIRASARAEFEAARGEADPELVNRMLVTGRDAVERTVEQFMARRARIIEEEAAAADARGAAGGGFAGGGPLGGGPLGSGGPLGGGGGLVGSGMGPGLKGGPG
jgi:hypothetical protein